MRGPFRSGRVRHHLPTEQSPIVDLTIVALKHAEDKTWWWCADCNSLNHTTPLYFICRYFVCVKSLENSVDKYPVNIHPGQSQSKARFLSSLALFLLLLSPLLFLLPFSILTQFPYYTTLPSRRNHGDFFIVLCGVQVTFSSCWDYVMIPWIQLGQFIWFEVS